MTDIDQKKVKYKDCYVIIKKQKNTLKWKPKYLGKKGLEKGLKKQLNGSVSENNLKKYKTDIYNT